MWALKLMIKSKIYVPISNKMAIVVGQTYKSCLLVGGGQQTVFSLTYFALSMHLFAPYWFYHIFCKLSLLRSFRPYIRPRTLFAGRNHACNHLPNIFAQTAYSRYWVFVSRTTTISTPKRVAHVKRFNAWACDIEDVGVNIYKEGRCKSELSF